MIKLKTDKDIQLIEKAIQIGEDALSLAEEIASIGITTQEIDRQIEKYILKNDAKPSFKGYKNFPSSSCISINEEIVHGIPSKRKIKEGDIIKIDVGINFKDRYSDQAKTYMVGDYSIQKSDNILLVEATKEALFRAKNVAKVGNSLKMIGRAIEETAKEFGVNILKNFCGHGVGFRVHEEPQIFNKSYLNNLIDLKRGMVIAIEPMFTLGDGNYKIHSNGLTVIVNGIGAHFEETVIIK